MGTPNKPGMGATIRHLRGATPIRKLAKKAGVGWRNVYRIEADDGEPTLSTLGALSRALGYDLDLVIRLADGREPMPKRGAA